jgi:signal transduction histidine kinase
VTAAFAPTGNGSWRLPPRGAWTLRRPGAAIVPLAAAVGCLTLALLAPRLPAGMTGQGLIFIGPLSALLLLVTRRDGHRPARRWLRDVPLRGLALAASLVACSLTLLDLERLELHWLSPGPRTWGVALALGLSSLVAVSIVEGTRSAWSAWERLRRRRLLWSVLHVQLVSLALLLLAPALVIHLVRSEVPSVVAAVAASCDGVLARWAAVGIVGVIPTGLTFTVAIALGLAACLLPALGVSVLITRRLEARGQQWARGLHELRHPLAVMRCHLGGAPDPVEDTATLSASRHELTRMERLMDELSPLAGASAATAHAHPEQATLALGPWMERFTAHWSPVAWRLSRVTFLGNAEGQQVTVPCDALRLEQLLTNLIWNALGHTPAGGLVHLGARVVDDRLQLELRDSGPGVPPELAATIFRPGVHGGGGGSGLGLAVCHDLARELGGELRLMPARDSAGDPGGAQGACFRLTLPLR